MKALSHLDTSVDENVVAMRSPVRVCMHVRGSLRTDGRVMREASALVKEGFAVSVIDVERQQTCSIVEDFGDIRVKHLVKPHWYIPTRMPWRLLRSAEKFIVCTSTMIGVPAEIYHAHDVNALPACYIAAMLRRKPLIFDAHELPLYELDHLRWHWLSALLRRLLAGMLSHCAGTITVSSPIAQEIRTRYHAQEISLVRNVPVYQAVSKSNRLRQHLGLGPEIRIALYQGNLQPDRGLHHLIRAAAFLKRDTVIVLMGRGIGTTLTQLEALIDSEGVTDRVKVLPPVPYEELLDWTASADIGLIIYSPNQSLNVQMCLPNKLFEYLMAGLPVLATPLDAVADILNTYDVGQIVSSLAPADIAAAINAMLRDQSVLERMHRNALDAVQHDLCWEEERQQLIDLYQSILARE